MKMRNDLIEQPRKNNNRLLKAGYTIEEIKTAFEEVINKKSLRLKNDETDNN